MSLRTRVAHWLLRAVRDVGYSIVNGAEPTDYQANGRTVRRTGWERNPVVNACARAIVDIFAAVDLEVYRKRADGTAEVIPNHDAAILLNTAPRAGMNGHFHRALTGLHYLLYGNSQWVLERGGRKRIQGIRLVHPERIQFAFVNPEGEIVRYQWRDIHGETHESAAEDVIHFRDLTASEDFLFGYPRAAAALQDIAADYEATQYVRQVVTNHGQPGMVIATKGYKRKEDLTAAEEKFNEKMIRRGGRGGALFVNAEETTITPIGFSLNDLEFPDLRAITREDICAVFHVDPRMVGIGSATSEGGMSGVQFREARFKLIQQAVVPVMKAVESELDRWYMPEWGNVFARFRPDTLSELTEDETATAERGLKELEKAAISVEEYRDLTGRDADLDQTHHIIQGGQIVAVSVALAQADLSPADKAKELAEAVPEPGQGGEGTQARGLRAAYPAAPPVRVPLIRAGQLPPEDRLRLWHEFDTRATRQEPPFLRVLRLLFEYERARLGDALRSQQIVDDLVMEALFRELAVLYGPSGDIYTRWVEDTAAVIAGTLTEGLTDQVKLGHTREDFLIENPRAQNAIRRRANKLAGNVTATTYEQIRGLVLLGRQQGMTVSQLADLINEVVFDGTAPERSRTIARTESVGALNEGAFMAALQGGVMRSKMWLSQRDERVRETHTHAEGEGWIPLTKAFSNGLQYPGDQNGAAEEVINCRCTVLYSDEERPQ